MGRRAFAAGCLALLVVVIAAACDDGGDLRVVSRRSTGTTTPIPEVTQATAAGAPILPTATAATPLATPTEAPAPLSSLPGDPFSSADLDAALREQGLAATGRALTIECDRGADQRGVRLQLGDGSIVLLVYPSSAAFAEAWSTGDGATPRDSTCQYPAGTVFWNRNLALIMENVSGATRSSVREAFLSLQP